MTFAFCLLPFAFCLPGCGKRRPPQPPVEGVPQRTELLSGVQRGNQIILDWPAPLRNAPDESVQSIRRVDVYRLAESSDDPLALTEEEFSSRATLIGSVPFETIRAAAPGGAVSYTDELTLSDPVRLRYAVRYVNASNQRASFSNFLIIEPATGVSRPPTLTAPAEVTQNAIEFVWDAPAANMDGTRPANVLGYNVYRFARAEKQPAREPLNGARPLSATRFVDQSFSFGEEYVYVVRAVSLGTGGLPVESLNSNAISVAPRDTFPPAPPGAPTAAAPQDGGRISIFFPANTESDVVGYNIFRATDEGLPRSLWTKLNRAPLTRTTFQDETVQSGVKYFYYVTAIDNAGNESRPSEVDSETAP
ncbi:MAG TPA: hypothetical protein VF064_15075 [Pyrinomonadaceae bacterium]